MSRGFQRTGMRSLKELTVAQAAKERAKAEKNNETGSGFKARESTAINESAAQEAAEKYLKEKTMLYGGIQEGRYGDIEVPEENADLIEAAEQATSDIISEIATATGKTQGYVTALTDYINQMAFGEKERGILLEAEAQKLFEDVGKTSLYYAVRREEGIKSPDQVPAEYIKDNIVQTAKLANQILTRVAAATQKNKLGDSSKINTPEYIGEVVAEAVSKTITRQSNDFGYSEEYRKALWKDTTALVSRILNKAAEDFNKA